MRVGKEQGEKKLKVGDLKYYHQGMGVGRGKVITAGLLKQEKLERRILD